MEGAAQTKKDAFAPSEAQMEIIKKHFSMEDVIIDSGYNSVHVCLSQVEATRRAQLVSDIEYNFSLALKKGDNYLG